MPGEKPDFRQSLKIRFHLAEPRQRRALVAVAAVNALAFPAELSVSAETILVALCAAAGMIFVRRFVVYLVTLGIVTLLVASRLPFYFPSLALFSPVRASICLILTLIILLTHRPHVPPILEKLRVGPVVIAVLFPLTGIVAQDISAYLTIVVVAGTLLGLTLVHANNGWVRHRWFLAFWIIAATTQPQYLHFRDSPRDDLGRRLDEQEGVTRLFAPNRDDVPPELSAMYEPVEGYYVVLPHKPSTHAVFFRPNHLPRREDLAGGAANVSAVVDGQLYTVASRSLIEMNAVDARVRRQMKVPARDDRETDHDTLVYDPTRSRLYAAVGRTCHVISLARYTTENRLELDRAGTCLPMEKGERILLSRAGFPRRTWEVLDATTFQTLNARTHFDMAPKLSDYDAATERVFATTMPLGLLRVVDAAELTSVGRRYLRPGLFGVRVDPKRPYVYAWNYFTGEVLAMRSDSLQIVDRFRLGPVLRNLTISHDGDALLGVTKAGGFRVDLNARLTAVGVNSGT